MDDNSDSVVDLNVDIGKSIFDDKDYLQRIITNYETESFQSKANDFQEKQTKKEWIELYESSMKGDLDKTNSMISNLNNDIENISNGIAQCCPRKNTTTDFSLKRSLTLIFLLLMAFYMIDISISLIKDVRDHFFPSSDYFYAIQIITIAILLIAIIWAFTVTNTPLQDI